MTSPLSEYISVGRQLSQEEGEAFVAQQSVAGEEAMARCMHDQGFEYWPMAQTAASSAPSDDLQPGTNEWAEVYGFGYFTGYHSDANGTSTSDAQSAVEQNARYVASLTPDAQLAYQEAMWGSGSSPGSDEGALDGESTKTLEGGCRAVKLKAMGKPDDQDGFGELRSRIEEMQTSIESDPRVDQLWGEWSGCMAEAGYPDYESNFELIDHYARTFSEFVDQHSEGNGEINLESPDAKQRAQEEIAAATTSQSCLDTVTFDETMQHIQLEIEHDFVEENRAELERYKAHLEQNG